jgi:TfoX/Sxy family transcriptional regulator of competence genes
MFRKLRVISYQDAEEYLSFYRKRKNVTDEQRALKLDINRAVLTYADRRAAQSAAAFKALRSGG